VQFVLKKLPFGQVSPAFDVGLEGMRVGEERLITVPPVLGYGEQGIKSRRVFVPPNAVLIYDVRLMSINAVAF